MTEYLITARAVIILWTNLAVMPTEIVFDAIEAELERRGVASARDHSLRELSGTALVSE
jgi:DNA phosphorothioation-dependent restriction protein DptG